MEPRLAAGGRGPALRRAALALALAAVLPPVPHAAAQDPGGEPGLELTSPVRQQLRLLTEAWRSWTRAYYQGKEEPAAGALEQLSAIGGHLGMPRLPDLSNSAAAFAVLAAREGDQDRARWALEAARQLDPSRPETEFAEAAIRRLEGDSLGAARSTLAGYAKMLELPLERRIWLHNVALWAFYVLLASGGFFVALQMVTKGGALFYDLARFLSPPLSLQTADVITVLVLLWPLVLPSGLLWLALYWSILVWGYGSASEKAVFVALWLVLGGMPLVLSQQQRMVQQTLQPSVRAIDSLQARRLHGTLFSDLGVLQSKAPDDPTVREMEADLHRRFGQWEHARSIYAYLLEGPELAGRDSAGALNNIGVYHYRKKDYGTAVNYFRRATAADPELPEAFFNLAQAYSQLYKFTDSNEAMARAKELDRARVGVWEHAEVPVEEIAVPVDGGVRRADELRRQLLAAAGGEEATPIVDLWRRHLSLSVAAGVILLAVTLHLVRRQLGYRSSLLARPSLLPPAADRWARALVPGLVSARREHGASALAGVAIPVGLVLVPVVGSVGYRAPVAIDPGQWLPTALCLGGLLVLFTVRLGRELKRVGSGPWV